MEDVTSGGFIGKFGLDGRLLVAQMINVLILLFILSRFVFRPLLKIMRERSEHIAQGLRDADAARQEKAAVLAWEEEQQRKIKAEAAARLSKVEEEARARRDLLLRQTETDAQAMHDRAVAEAERLRADALVRAREDAGALVVDVAERLLSRRLSPEDREAFLHEALTEVRKRTRGAT